MGKSVTIIGAGPIGLMHLMLSKEVGATQIIVGDVSEPRIKMAEKMGADFVIDANAENPVAKVMKLTGGIGADIVITAVGVPSVIEQAIRMVRRGGMVNIFGGCPVGSTVTIDPNVIHYNELTLTGSFSTTPFMMQKAMNIISSGRVNVKPLITTVLPLNKLDEAMQIVAEKKESLKIVIKPQ